jgi:hypothetical protein
MERVPGFQEYSIQDIKGEIATKNTKRLEKNTRINDVTLRT